MTRGRTGDATSIGRHAILLISSAMMLLPFAWMVSLSLRTPSEIFDPNAPLIPASLAVIDNYYQALTSVPLPRFLLNGLFVCVAIALLQLMLCIPFAYALAKRRFRSRGVLFGLILFSLTIPSQVLAIPLFLMVKSVGLLNSYAALILPFAASPFGIFLLRQAFLRVPDDLIHAARLDGFSELAIIWTVVVPVAAPSIAAFLLYSFVAHWNELYWPMIVIRSENLMPPALGIMAFRDDDAGSQYGAMMAAATLVVTPTILVFLLSQRLFMQSGSFGSVK